MSDHQRLLRVFQKIWVGLSYTDRDIELYVDGSEITFLFGKNGNLKRIEVKTEVDE